MADDRYPRGHRPDPYGRGAPPAGQASDPLAELARLIGQNDPFSIDPRSAPRDARAQAAWPDATAGRDMRSGEGVRGAAPESAYDPDPYRRADSPVQRPAAPDFGEQQPGYADPRYADPRYTDPRQADPRYADPRYTDPRQADPRYADPRYTDPRQVDPRQVDPRYADPRYSDPRYADPHYPDPRSADPQGYGDPAYADDKYGYSAQGIHDPHYFPEDRPFPADGRGYDQTGLADYDAGRIGGEHDYEEDEAPRGRRGRHDGADGRPAPRRRRLTMVMAVLGLAVLGTAAAFGYRAVFSRSSGPAPVIRADNTPNKVVPAGQSGDASANKQIYDRVADRSQDERVVPREEQPVDIRDATRQATPQMVVPNAGSPAGPTLGSPPQSTGGFAPASANSTQEPRRIRTVTIRPDQGGDASARGATRPAAQATAAAGTAARQGAARAQDSGGPLSLTPDNVTAQGAAAPPARSRTAAVAPAAPQPAAANAGGPGYVVQVLAQSTEAEAQSSFRSMQARYPNQLGGLQPIIRRKEVGGGVKFGAQVGPYATREEAVRLCDNLKAAGGSCFVAKN